MSLVALRAAREELGRLERDVDAGYANGVRDDDVDEAVQRVLAAVGSLLACPPVAERQQRIIEATEAMLRTVHRNGAAPMDVLVAVKAMLQNEQRAGAGAAGQAAPARAAAAPRQG